MDGKILKLLFDIKIAIEEIEGFLVNQENNFFN